LASYLSKYDIVGKAFRGGSFGSGRIRGSSSRKIKQVIADRIKGDGSGIVVERD
jgi:hypothetical protein